jgi:acyl-CoA hydrolase
MLDAKRMTAEQAAGLLRSESRVFIHSVAAAPQALIKAMVARASELRGVEVVHLHTEGPAPYTDPGMQESFFHRAFFVGKNVRQAVNEGRADYIPVFLSDIPSLFRNDVLPLDAALISVSPPDKHGFCTLGPSVDATRAAVEKATTVIAQVNRHLPRTQGDGVLHVNEIDAFVECDEMLHEAHAKPSTETEERIGRFCAELIEDGATIQMGIGGIPNAVLAALKDHKDLGVHTEMFSDGLIDLIESGVVNNRLKKVVPGRVVTTFSYGSQRLYDFLDDNAYVYFREVCFVNDTSVIRKNPKVTAINSAIEVDLTGQVCADTIGTRQYSGVGGQMDFMRGAALSEGGKPIIALPSITTRGESRIVDTLRPGADVVTTRAHVRFIVTEYGVADLQGKSLQQRAKALISIAHPSQREALECAARQRFGPHF